MSTEGSKYVNKEIKNSVKGLKQIKTLIEHTNDERKSLLSSLEEAKRKKEVRKSQVTTSPLRPSPLEGRESGVLAHLGCPADPRDALLILGPSRAVSPNAGTVVKKPGWFICF